MVFQNSGLCQPFMSPCRILSAVQDSMNKDGFGLDAIVYREGESPGEEPVISELHNMNAGVEM